MTAHTLRRLQKKNWALAYLGGECVNCGSTDKLEFDHIKNDRQGKTGLISQLTSASWDRLKKELEKCQLLCNSCHVQKSILDHGKNKASHGSLAMYKNAKCRCDECRSANAGYMREYKKRNK